MSHFLNELRALTEARAPRLKYFQPVILGGFSKEVPSKVKLWDIKPSIPDELEPTQRETKFHRNLHFLAKNFDANEEQFEATERSYSAPAGLSLVHGGRKTGKTVTAILQALTAVSIGHKVILCAPTAGYDDLKDLLRSHMSEIPEGSMPKVYIADNPDIEDLNFKVYELCMASNDPDCSMPITLSRAVWEALRDNVRTFNSPENQALYRDRQHYHPSLQTLVESQQLWDGIWTEGSTYVTEDATDVTEDCTDEDQDSLDKIEDERKRLLYLYNKIYFRIIAEADIIVTSCHDAGTADLYRHFRPTVAIVDSCNLASEPEAWIPLLMYKDIRFRILLGNRSELRPHTFPPSDPWAGERQLSLLEHFALTEVPVYELKSQFLPPKADRKHEGKS